MTLLIGIDVGTTNIKAVLYDPASGTVCATASRPMITHHLGVGWSEFHPDEIWNAVKEVVREVAGATARGGVAAVAVAPLGSRGLLWLPHFMGSGSPECDPHSRGALLGLTLAHTRGEMVRSLLEALCYWLRQNVELVEEELGKEMREIIAIGGATKARLWTQLKADVTARPVRVPALSQATATGAALLAGVGAGVFADEAAAVDSLTVQSKVYPPDPADAERYTTLYHDLYLPVYPLLKETSHKLATMPQTKI